MHCELIHTNTTGKEEVDAVEITQYLDDEWSSFKQCERFRFRFATFSAFSQHLITHLESPASC